MKNTLYIGISGYARSGKDSCAIVIRDILLNKGYTGKIISLATQLKKEIDQFFVEQYGISAFTEDSVAKEQIRPLLISHGNNRRRLSNGSYFTEHIDRKLKEDPVDFVIVPDIRYAEYSDDELYWLESKILSYELVHIRKYITQDGNREYQVAPNEFELKNDPILRERATINVEFSEDEGNQSHLEIKKETFGKLF